jgi:predicted phosphodiesterase
MEVIRYTIEIPDKSMLNGQFSILFMGDWHVGNPGCDDEKLKKALEKIKTDPFCYTILMGDLIENATPLTERSLKTFNLEAVLKSKSPLPSQQVRIVRALLEPIKHKIIGALIGNHEDRAWSHDDFRLNITEPLGINYLGDKAYIALDFVYRGKLVHQYKLVVGHSRFGGKYDGTVGMAAEKAFNEYEDFDCLAFGHTHFSFAHKKFRKFLRDVDGKLELMQRKYYLINTGTFLRSEVQGVDLYPDKTFGGGVREPGTVTLSFIPGKGELYAHA